jgi:SH3-like domain-containing protein
MMHRPSRVVRLNGKGIAVKWQVVVCFFYFVTSTAQGLCVKVLEANLKSSPDPNSPITWTVGKFTPLVRLEKKGSWYKVEDQDGDQHWVSARFVTTQYQCVSVRGKAANLRAGPGTEFPIAAYATADKYWPFKRIDRREDWYQVEDDLGNSFWVHDSAVWRPVTVSRIGF